MINKPPEYFMREALLLAEKAASQDEVPVGAVVVLNQNIIGRGYNQPIKQHDPSAHAEIMALRDAGQTLKNYRLIDCDLYVTLEPCPMCAGAIIQARIKTVFFATTDPKGGAAGSKFDLLPSDQRFNHQTTIHAGLLAENGRLLLKQFFQQKRQSKKQFKTKI